MVSKGKEQAAARQRAESLAEETQSELEDARAEVEMLRQRLQKAREDRNAARAERDEARAQRGTAQPALPNQSNSNDPELQAQLEKTRKHSTNEPGKLPC